MNWKDYEVEIFELCKTTYKDASITFNQTLEGRYSHANRQIDVLIESYIAGKKIRLIIDGKFFNKNIDVKDVESFISMVEDVDAKQGILVTSKGFSTAAINRAYYGPTDVELDILNFEDLKQFQGAGGFIHSGKYGAMIPAPFGWIIDGDKKDGTLSTFYQRGLTFEQATKNKEWMYSNIFIKNADVKSLDDLVKFQEEYTKIQFPKATIKYQSTIMREDKAETLLRTIKIDTYPTNEYTGFIEFDDFFVFFVLFSPIELASKNIRKLENLLERTLKMEVHEESILQTNYNRLQQLLEKSSDQIETAELLIGQAEILISLNKIDDAFSKYNQSITKLKTSYGAIKGKILIGLIKKLTIEKLTPLIDDFYDLEPTNPTICNDVMELFVTHNRIEDLIHFLKYGSEKYKENKEAVGNFNYNLGLLFAHLENKKESENHFLIAKTAFAGSLEKGDDIFGLIEQNMKRVKEQNRS
jgi:hypothetical protein